MKTENIYPIYESVDESWERLSRIYSIIDELIGMDYVVPISTQDIKQAWCCIAMFLGNAHDFLNGIDFMYEAIYHVRYRRFSENVSTHNELLLTLLIEDELCRCGYAFHVWSSMQEFKNVYKELLWPSSKSRAGRAFCPWYMKMYLAGNMANQIMLKNTRPVDWGDKLDCERATFPYGPDYMRYRVTVYEQAIGILFPESDQWHEEWMDGQYIAERIRDRYKMDFTKDSAGYDNLIGLVLERKHPQKCALYLYRLNNVTPELLEKLWGNNAHEMVQKCFWDIFGRYKAAKKRTQKRSRYSYQAIKQSWLGQWVEQRKEDNDPKLSLKTRQAWFRIAMNM